jgi:hypothetical protein
MRKGTVYRIVVRSELGDRYAPAFEGMRMEIQDGQTILIGEVVDQPQLFGILDRINGLGLDRPALTLRCEAALRGAAHWRGSPACRKALFSPLRLSVMTAANPSGSHKESGTSREKISSV